MEGNSAEIKIKKCGISTFAKDHDSIYVFSFKLNFRFANVDNQTYYLSGKLWYN